MDGSLRCNSLEAKWIVRPAPESWNVPPERISLWKILVVLNCVEMYLGGRNSSQHRHSGRLHSLPALRRTPVARGSTEVSLSFWSRPGRIAAVLALHAASCCMGLAQANRPDGEPLLLPFPVSMEWAESFHPFAENKFATDRFKLQGGTESYKLQFSTEAPDFLGGKQFQGIPGGYRHAEFSLLKKWGSVHAFRSAGYDAHRVSRESARSISGAGVELPKSLFGSLLSAYLLRAAPAGEAAPTAGNPLAGSDGLQIGFFLARELRKNARMQAEWTQTRNSPAPSGTGISAGSTGKARRGLRARVEGTFAGADLNVSYLHRDEGLANPATPSYGPSNNSLLLDVRRGLGKHQLGFSSLYDGQRESADLRMAIRTVREESFQWTYSPRRLPQISISRGWSRQSSASRNEAEESVRLSLSKAFPRVGTSLLFSRGSLKDLTTSGVLWQRTAIAGDATLEIRKERRLHVRYENSLLRQGMIARELSSSTLQFDTNISLCNGALSLAPALTLRRQAADPADLNLSAVRVALLAGIRLPRYIPGTDLLVNFASHHLHATGGPDQNGAEFSMRWNLKRM